jgi:hypothetical protein
MPSQLLAAVPLEENMTTPSLTCGKCDNGWICKEHPDQPWPHDDCAGPGIPCDVPTCPYRIDVRPVHTQTGLVCPNCRQPVAQVERTTSGLLFECPRCGNRWSWSGTKALMMGWATHDHDPAPRVARAMPTLLEPSCRASPTGKGLTVAIYRGL